MALLILGLLLFLGVHSVSIVTPAGRRALGERFGEQRWALLHSLIAALGFALIVIGYGAARVTFDTAPLYDPPGWMRHLTLLLMLPVFPLLFAAYLPGRIQTATKHPMLLAVKIWAFAHLLANGGLADALLFGTFLAWAVLDRISFKRRPSAAPPGAAPGRFNDLIALALGLSLYAAFIPWLHRWFIGVAPLG